MKTRRKSEPFPERVLVYRDFLLATHGEQISPHLRTEHFVDNKGNEKKSPASLLRDRIGWGVGRNTWARRMRRMDERDTHRDREKNRQTDRNRERERETEIYGNRDRDRQRQKQRERETETQRQTDRQAGKR